MIPRRSKFKTCWADIKKRRVALKQLAFSVNKIKPKSNKFDKAYSAINLKTIAFGFLGFSSFGSFGFSSFGLGFSPGTIAGGGSFGGRGFLPSSCAAAVIEKQIITAAAKNKCVKIFFIVKSPLPIKLARGREIMCALFNLSNNNAKKLLSLINHNFNCLRVYDSNQMV
jgi:hypothetical protein